MPISPEKIDKLVCANEIARRFDIAASTLKMWRDKRDCKEKTIDGREFPRYYSFHLSNRKLYDPDEFREDLANATDPCRGPME